MLFTTSASRAVERAPGRELPRKTKTDTVCTRFPPPLTDRGAAPLARESR